MNVYFCDFCGKPLAFIPCKLILETETLYEGKHEWKEETTYGICSDCASSLSDKRIDTERKLYKQYKERLHE